MANEQFGWKKTEEEKNIEKEEQEQKEKDERKKLLEEEIAEKLDPTKVGGPMTLNMGNLLNKINEDEQIKKMNASDFYDTFKKHFFQGYDITTRFNRAYYNLRRKKKDYKKVRSDNPQNMIWLINYEDYKKQASKNHMPIRGPFKRNASVWKLFGRSNEGFVERETKLLREFLYYLAFVLKLNEEEINKLFTTTLYDRPFNMRDPFEFICYYCVNTNKTYDDVKNLYEDAVSECRKRDNNETSNYLFARTSDFIIIKERKNELLSLEYDDVVPFIMKGIDSFIWPIEDSRGEWRARSVIWGLYHEIKGEYGNETDPWQEMRPEEDSWNLSGRGGDSWYYLKKNIKPFKEDLEIKLMINDFKKTLKEGKIKTTGYRGLAEMERLKTGISLKKVEYNEETRRYIEKRKMRAASKDYVIQTIYFMQKWPRAFSAMIGGDLFWPDGDMIETVIHRTRKSENQHATDVRKVFMLLYFYWFWVIRKIADVEITKRTVEEFEKSLKSYLDELYLPEVYHLNPIDFTIILCVKKAVEETRNPLDAFREICYKNSFGPGSEEDFE